MYFRHAICLLLFIKGVLSSHFHGGTMSIAATENLDKVQITYRLSWRKSYAREYSCNANVAASLETIYVEGELSTVGGCKGRNLTQLPLKCTDSSEVDDWMSGMYSLEFECRAPFISLRYTGVKWRSVQNGGNHWSLYLNASLTKRSDTNKVNRSPISVMQPINRLLYGCQQNITIPVADNDGDKIKCRWSVPDIVDECGGVCNRMPGIVLDEAAGVGTYVVAIQVEDYISSASTVPMSSIPVQFLIEVDDVDTECDHIPKVTDSNLSHNGIIEIPSGSAFQDRVVAEEEDETHRIVAIDIIGPEGMNNSNLQPVEDDTIGNKWFVDVFWLPADGQEGKHLFCYMAINDIKVASPQTCKELLAGTKTTTSAPPNLDDTLSTDTIIGIISLVISIIAVFVTVLIAVLRKKGIL